jgi:low temperature requirement protein LtrA
VPLVISGISQIEPIQNAEDRLIKGLPGMWASAQSSATSSRRVWALSLVVLAALDWRLLDRFEPDPALSPKRRFGRYRRRCLTPTISEYRPRMFTEFRRRFWLPPRAHGDIIRDRTVSFLELFYDLVYVVVIGRAAHTLAVEVSWRTVGEFIIVFGLIWFAWLNGTLYYELHGREDGRTRAYVFLQMLLLTLLAVFAGDAGGASGAAFAVVYTLYLVVVTWLWYTVRRQDSEEYMAVTGLYLGAMAVSIVVMAASALLPGGWRMVAWGCLVGATIVAGILISHMAGTEFGLVVTDSMVERYGLFVIIVLGEVIVGVVAGLAEADNSIRSIATGLIGLSIGFAYWWSYFDFAGRRLPVDTPPIRMRWILAHLPVTMSIAAAGAAMVSLIVHAGDAATPAPTAWLLCGSVAGGLVALVLVMRTLRDYDRFRSVYQPLSGTLLIAAGAGLLAGWWAPAPWLLGAALVVTLVAVWIFAVDRWLRLDDPGAMKPRPG